MPSCEIVGDPDLYGLGVRLAIYSQTAIYLIADALGTTRSAPILEIPCTGTELAMMFVMIRKYNIGQLTPFDAMITLFMTGSLDAVRPIYLSDSRRFSAWGRLLFWAKS